MQTDSLPLELWDQVASQLSRNDYVRCLSVNKDLHDLMTCLLLPKYGSELPRQQEILDYIRHNPIILLDSKGGWMEIDALAGKTDRYIVYSKKEGCGTLAVVKSLAEITETINFASYTLDPKSYSDILRQRKSVVRMYPNYVEDMTLLYIEEMLKHFSEYGTIKWRILGLVIDIFTQSNY